MCDGCLDPSRGLDLETFETTSGRRVRIDSARWSNRSARISVDSMIAASSNSVRTISRREATIPALVNDG
jgi:hypothetical protein